MSFRLRLFKHRVLVAIGLGEKQVRIPRFQTARLRLIPGPDSPRLRPEVFDCPLCCEGDEGVLVMMELETKGPDRKTMRPADRKKHPPLKMLLRITRPQLDDIRSEFPRPPPGGPGPRTDRDAALGSLVP